MNATPPDVLTLGRLRTPIGTALLVTDEAGTLRAFNWSDYEPHMRRWLAKHYGAATLVEGVSPVADAFSRYFGEGAGLEAVRWRARGTDFQRQVWGALIAIPAGQTVSYQTLAARIGRPTAVRAVGLANGANPVAVIVPCHRVIGADGSLTGYGGGLPRKEWLLAHERAWAARRAA